MEHKQRIEEQKKNGVVSWMTEKKNRMEIIC